MRPAIIFTAWVGATSVAAAEPVRTEICTRGDDGRRIEIESPGTVGAACDVVYIRDGGANVTIPYNANVDRDFCRARAAEMAADLMAEGFQCSESTGAELEAALVGGSSPSQASAPTPAPVVVADTPPPETSPATAPTPALTPELMAEPSQSVAPPQVADASSDLPLNEQLEILEQPVAVAAADPLQMPAVANGAPVQLAGEARAIEYHAPRPSRTTGAGRLVGPAPSLEGIVDEAAIASPVVAAAAEKQVAEVTPADAPKSARPTEDIVAGVLAATVAGWNEGNLGAYLAGYADTPDVTVVRNGAATAGFGAVRKYFEEEIDAAGGMGRLAFEELGVTVASADVTKVTGRYTRTVGDKSSNGALALVMKQTEGRWRIVSDTRVDDAPPPPPLKN